MQNLVSFEFHQNVTSFIVNNIEQEFNSLSNVKSALFQMIGFDILIDRNFKPWLLEINHTPSLITYNDKVIDENTTIRVRSDVD